jgi:hypothetical protein
MMCIPFQKMYFEKDARSVVGALLWSLKPVQRQVSG